MILLVEIFCFWFERGLVYCRLFRLIILRLMQYVIEEIHLFVCELFWLLYFSVLVLLTFFWLQLLLTPVLLEPINHDQSFLLRAREICVLMAEQLFQYLQPALQNRCLFVCSVRKNAALIEMLDCCSMPPYQIIF